MTSYVLSFWNTDESEEKKNEQKSLGDSEPSFTNFIQELQAFQKEGKLKKVVVEKQAIKGPTKIWKEILEQRTRILKIENELSNEECDANEVTPKDKLEERVKALEDEVKELKSILTGQSWRSSSSI